MKKIRLTSEQNVELGKFYVFAEVHKVTFIEKQH